MGDRLYKINEQIKKDIGNYVQENFASDGGLITVTAVETTPDLRHAKVWIGYIGSQRGSVISNLKHHTKEIQSYLNGKLTMKYIPQISFLLDQSGDYAQHISKIIDGSL